MDKMWGSTCSLGGLLADSLLCEGSDNFLEDLPNFPDAKSGEFMPDIAACSGSNSMDSSVSADTGLGAPDAISALFNSSCAPGSLPLPISSALMPTNAAFSQGWPNSIKAEPAPNMDAAVSAANLQLLQQLLGGIQTGAITLPPPPPPPPPAQVAANLLSQLAALKSTAPPAPKPVFAPVSNAGPTAAVVPEISAAPVSQPVSLPPNLPGLNEQQQEALRSLVMGQLGTTSEGKKVRRMLSNRESARRSRHRKQAHMQTLEQKSSEMENENMRLKEAVARAATQELKAMEERTRLYTEVAELRDKCARLEAIAANCKASSKASEQSTKKGLSHSSSADGCSDDSCDSVPAKRRVASDSEEEGACKRCRRCEAKAH